MGKKRGTTGQPKKNPNPGWKARATQIKREAAEARDEVYAALPMAEKIKRAGKKQKENLEKKT